MSDSYNPHDQQRQSTSPGQQPQFQPDAPTQFPQQAQYQQYQQQGQAHQIPHGYPYQTPPPGQSQNVPQGFVNTVKSMPQNLIGASLSAVLAVFMLLFSLLPWSVLPFEKVSLKTNGWGALRGDLDLRNVLKESLDLTGSTAFSFYMALPMFLVLTLVTLGAVLFFLNKNKVATYCVGAGSLLGFSFSTLYIISGAKMDYYALLAALAFSRNTILDPNLGYGVFLYFIVAVIALGVSVFVLLKDSEVIKNLESSVFSFKGSQGAQAPHNPQQPIPPQQGFYPPQGQAPSQQVQAHTPQGQAPSQQGQAASRPVQANVSQGQATSQQVQPNASQGQADPFLARPYLPQPQPISPQAQAVAPSDQFSSFQDQPTVPRENIPQSQAMPVENRE